ncbi:aminotransferase-like domain-containing protein [Neobacillus rhizophilus]|uniref:PLP-dependent aminotransferase family protein n=1 Tax=Neobacillus rhizophilus TaxID=2833579 RepID=A0A942U863_9BACI|nr:PLP-dependent aminotransferase family protein [Neobacillus rhizophilus]MBS4214322.1 PLP-dependent aminotransferase family protein [Neobacillus rhizophilus]
MPVNSFEDYPMSWKPDKKQLVTPLYQSIASLLEYDILNGYLAPNTKLPPQRELADYLDVNLSTVTRAFKICEVKGLIYAVTGRGTFVTPNIKNAIFMADSDENKNVIEMGIIKPLDHTNSFVAQAIKSIAAKDYLENLLDYRHPLGMPYHRMAAKKWMQRFNMDVSIENIAITSGGQNSFSLILMALFHPGDKIAVDIYTYPNFMELAKMLKIQLIPIEGDELGINPERLDAVCKTNSLQGIYLSPSCNNPTAVTMNMNRRKEIAEVINKHGLILIEDDVYSFLAPDGYFPISHFVPEKFVYILSIAKSLSSGIRVAFVAYANQFTEKITYGIFNLNVKTSALNAEIVTELINTGAAEQIVKKKQKISQERNQIYQKYFQINHQYENPISYFRWIPLHKEWQLNQFEHFALTRGIHVYHSHRFLVKKEESPQFIRISLTSPKDSDELEKGLCILKRFLLESDEVMY